MLFEKYRPTSFDNVVGMEKEIKFLQEKIKSPDGIPHLLFVGNPGSGKTLTANIIANEVLGKYKEQNFFEFNASNDNGVDFIRNQITPLAKRKPMGIPYKIILMDEADYMTPEAQACCRRIMEQSNKITRFILTANYPYKIIQPIISRCQTIEFKSPSIDTLKKQASFIADQEKINLDAKQIEDIANKSNGDFRKLYSLLEHDSTEESMKEFDNLTLSKIKSMPQNQRVQLAFNGDPYEVFNRLWEMAKKEKAWNLLALFADCNFKMNSSMHKNLFLANLMDKLGA